MINLLIVDDDMATVEVIETSIDWGRLGIAEVLTAYNVAGAKLLLSQQKIDIIVSDIEMPQESGLDLLKWVREANMECEFLLLTCHEKFAYATDAINYDASAYITKPFDADIMELNLQKIITKLNQKRSLKKSSEYGAWMEKNIRLMKLDFWKAILDGELIQEERIEAEVQSRHLDIPYDREFCLVYTKLSNIDADVERYGKNVFEFVLEGFHSEILTGHVENESVIKYHTEDSLCFIAVCEEDAPGGLKEKCKKLIETSKGYFKTTLTCCSSDAYAIVDLFEAKNRIKKLYQYNISYYGRAFHEHEVEIPVNNEMQILDIEKITTFLEEKDKPKILNHLKKVFDELSAIKKLHIHSLYLMKQEMIQVVYAHLMKQGIQATKLFYDELSIRMSDHALDSTIDMIRWVNYLLEKTFAYEEEIEKSATIIDKINKYIHEHYMEDIGRNEIAGEFYLTPEYLAKLYKKKTGMNLKDYINDYRIEVAKELLKTGEKNISNIAESVGFDNFSYFSTLFKKITGVSPKDYKHN